MARAKTMNRAMLERIRVTGKGLTADLVDSCIGASFGTSMDQVTELKLSFQDSPDLDLFKSGALKSGASVAYGAWNMVSRVNTLSSGQGGPVLDITAPSLYVERLRAQTGEKNWGNADVSAWVESVAKSVGMVPVVQPKLGKRKILRAKPDGGNKESTWDVLGALSTAVGVWLFEYGNQLIFAKPSWMMSHPWMRRTWPLVWDDWANYSEGMAGMPTYTRDPNGNPAETLTVRLVSADADTARPGDEVTISGRNVGDMKGRWIVTSVKFPMTVAAPVTVGCQRPIDPTIPPEPVAASAPGVAGKPKPSTATKTAGPSTSAVDRWVASVNGRAIDMDGAFGAQCVDLANHYHRNVAGGQGLVYANGNQWFNNAPSSLYLKYPVGFGPNSNQISGETARRGDIMCWNGVYGGGYGHVAIVLADQGNHVLCMSQNPGPARPMSLSKAGLQGYLRPKRFG